MKNVLILIASLMLIGSVAVASPLTDYSAGKGSIDLTWRNTTNSGTAAGAGLAVNGDSSSKYNLDGALTFGLNNNFAFQFRTFSPESKDTLISGGGGMTNKSKYSADEYNVLYKVDKNVAVFTGLVNAKGRLTFSNPTLNFSTKSKNLWQIGLIGSSPIADRTTLWASVAARNSNMVNWEIGASYGFAPNLELNVNYRQFKANDFTGYLSNGSAVNVSEVKSRGLGFGVTYKF